MDSKDSNVYMFIVLMPCIHIVTICYPDLYLAHIYVARFVYAQSIFGLTLAKGYQAQCVLYCHCYITLHVFDTQPHWVNFIIIKGFHKSYVHACVSRAYLDEIIWEDYDTI